MCVLYVGNTWEYVCVIVYIEDRRIDNVSVRCKHNFIDWGHVRKVVTIKRLVGMQSIVKANNKTTR
jgi:hypothetical protein